MNWIDGGYSDRFENADSTFSASPGPPGEWNEQTRSAACLIFAYMADY